MDRVLREGWEVRKLREICELSAGGDVPKDDFSKFKTEEKQVPIYANGEKNNGLYGYTSIGKITKPSITVSARGTIGFSVKRLESFYPIVRLISVTPKNLQILDLIFLDYAIKGIDFIHSGSSIPQLTIPMIQDYQIPLPPLKEQQRIVAILDEAFSAIEKAKANAQLNLKNAKELFESYLQSVFENRGEDWEEKKLIDVCLVERGSSPRPIKKYITDSEDGVNWIKIGDTKNVDKYIYSTNQKITKEGAEKSRYVKEGDFILSNSMSFGKPYIMKTDGYIHDGWFVLRLYDFIDTEYFFQLLSSPYVNGQFHKLASGSVVKNISGDLVKKVILPIPPIQDQKTIVKKLDALSEQTKKLESHYEQKLQDLGELKKAILQKAFNGEL